MRVLLMIPDIGISNGVMSVILNYAKAMPDDIIFDVVYFSESDKTRRKDIEALGGRVFKIDAPSPVDLFTKKMDSFFKNHMNEWQAVHIHCPHFAVFMAPAARRAGIKKIAMHCHSTLYSLSLNKSSQLRNEILYKLGSNKVDKKFACGTDAGHFWYGDDKKFTVLRNAVDSQKFKYDEQKRNHKRAELGIERKFVVGHIGQVSIPQKNHTFLIEIFAKIKEKKSNSVLLLAGAEKTPELDELIKSLNIENDVMFLGIVSDIPDFLNALDIFVFPSTREGLPVSVVEAQASGVPVLMSDSITSEVVICDNVQSLSLNDSTDKWADTAISLSDSPRKDCSELIKKSGWDIYDCAEKLAGYYRE